MKKNIFILLILATLLSCDGQTQQPTFLTNELFKPMAIADTVSELGKNIMRVYQDAKHNHWFCSWEDGVYKYDGKTLLHFTTKQGLPANRVEEVQEDANGNLYFNTSKGVCQYNGYAITVLTPTLQFLNDWQLKPNDLWFRCIDRTGFVYRYDGRNLFQLPFPKTAIAEEYIAQHPNTTNPYDTYCIYKDKLSNLWFGTALMGVWRYNGKRFDWIIEPDLHEMHNGPANGVRSIVEDQDGDFWFNTAYRYRINDGGDATISQTDSRAFYTRIQSLGSLDGKVNGDANEFLSIIKDNQNNLWMSMYLYGVWKYDGTNITHFPIQVDAKNIPIYSLYQDRQGSIWLGTPEHGVFTFTGKTFERFMR